MKEEKGVAWFNKTKRRMRLTRFNWGVPLSDGREEQGHRREKKKIGI